MHECTKQQNIFLTIKRIVPIVCITKRMMEYLINEHKEINIIEHVLATDKIKDIGIWNIIENKVKFMDVLKKVEQLIINLVTNVDENTLDNMPSTFPLEISVKQKGLDKELSGRNPHYTAAETSYASITTNNDSEFLNSAGLMPLINFTWGSTRCYSN